MTKSQGKVGEAASGQTLPKAELHCHLEGAAYPELVKKLAKRHGASLDDIIDDKGAYIWSDFTSFLQCWDRVAAVIRTPEDYADLVEDYLLRNAQEGCLYTEFFISPDHVALMGMSYDNLLEGIIEGYERAKATSVQNSFPIEARFIVTCVRHMGPEKAVGVAKTIAKRPHPLITGFGMGGDERMHSQKAFAPAFEIARDAGLKCTTHAGEFGGPQSVTDALDHLPVDRIGHGVRACEDPDLMKRLADEEITLEVCPGSNMALGLYGSRADHPLKRLMDAGIKTTLSSDDPPFFHTSLGEEYDAMADINGWSRDMMLGFTKRSLQAAYLDEATRSALLARLAPELK